MNTKKIFRSLIALMFVVSTIFALSSCEALDGILGQLPAIPGLPTKGCTHTMEETAAKAATCEQAGNVQYFTCTTCEKVYLDEAGTTETTLEETVILAKGHQESTLAAVAPTCTATGLTAGKKCSVCSKLLVAQQVVEMLDHTEETIAAVAPTCTEAGLTAGKKCSVCQTVTVAQETVAALGHTEEDLAAVAATCTEAGLTAGKKCSVCQTVTVAQETVDALGHTEEDLAAVAPTCTDTGLTAGKKCSVCQTVTVAQETVAALGHTEETLAAVAATCTEAGLTAGKKCSVCQTITVAQETVAALGHTETELAAVAPTCTATGLTAGKKCSVCNTVTVAQETVAALGHNMDAGVITTPATCTEAGVKTYTCQNNCGETTTETINALGHDMDDGEYIVVPTCTEGGTIKYTCKNNCGRSYTEEVDPAHNLVADEEGKAATCFEDGYTAGVHCTECDFAEGSEVIPAGHTIVDVEARAKTCYTDGYNAHKACTVCGYAEGKVVDRAGHTGTWVEDGNNEYIVCTTCGRKATREKNTVITFENGAIYDADGKLSATIGALKGEGEASVAGAADLTEFGNARDKFALVDDVAGKVLKVVSTKANVANYGESTVTIKHTDADHSIATGGKYLVFDFDAKFDFKTGTNTTTEMFTIWVGDSGNNWISKMAIQSYNQKVKANFQKEIPNYRADGTTWVTFRTVVELATEKDADGNYTGKISLYCKLRDVDGPMVEIATATRASTSTYAYVGRTDSFVAKLIPASVAYDYTYYLDNLSFIRTNDANYAYSACDHEIEETVTPATCTTEGSVVRACTVDGCGYSVTEVITASHTPGVAATCTSAQTCTACQTVLAPATGHVGAWVNVDDTYMERECETCGRIQKSEKNTPVADFDFPNETVINYTDALHATNGTDNGGKYLVLDFDILLDKSSERGTTEYVTTIHVKDAAANAGGGNVVASFGITLYNNDVRVAGKDIVAIDGETYLSFRLVGALAETADASGNYVSNYYLYAKVAGADGPMYLVHTVTKSSTYAGTVSRYDNYKIVLAAEAKADLALDVKNVSFIRTNDASYLYSNCNHNTVETVNCDGVANIVCTVDGCGYTAVEYVAGVGHELSGWITSANGIVEEQTCANCDFKETRTKGVITFDDGTITAGDAIVYGNVDTETGISSTGYTAYDVSTNAPGREGDAMLHALYDASKYQSGSNSTMTIASTGFVAEGATKQVYTLTFDTYIISPDQYGTTRTTFSVRFGGYNFGILTYGRNVRLGTTNISAHQKWISFKLVYVVTEDGMATFTASYKVEGAEEYVTYTDAAEVTGSSIKLADAMSVGFEMYGGTAAGYNPEFYMDNISFTTYTAE